MALCGQQSLASRSAVLAQLEGRDRLAARGDDSSVRQSSKGLAREIDLLAVIDALRRRHVEHDLSIRGTAWRS